MYMMNITLELIFILYKVSLLTFEITVRKVFLLIDLFVFKEKKKDTGDWRDARLLRAPYYSYRGPAFGSYTHISWPSTACNSSSWGYNASVAPTYLPTTHKHT